MDFRRAELQLSDSNASEAGLQPLKLQRLKPDLEVLDTDELKLVPPERPRLQDRKITRLPVVSKSWN